MIDFDKITITNNFMFATVMRDENICKRFLETMLDIKIEKLVYIESEKTFSEDSISKGIRLDVYVKDSERQFDLEMQVTESQDIPKRMRYYQSLLDIDFLEKGNLYKNLQKSYIIFICPYDLFKKGLPIYTFTNRCNEDSTIEFGDKTLKLVYNVTAWDKENIPAKKALLKYFNEGKSDDDFTKEIHHLVTINKNRHEWRTKYMTLEQELNLRYDDGLQKGAHDKAIETAKKLFENNVSINIISISTGLSVEEIQSICKNK